MYDLLGAACGLMEVDRRVELEKPEHVCFLRRRWPSRPSTKAFPPGEASSHRRVIDIADFEVLHDPPPPPPRAPYWHHPSDRASPPRAGPRRTGLTPWWSRSFGVPLPLTISADVVGEAAAHLEQLLRDFAVADELVVIPALFAILNFQRSPIFSNACRMDHVPGHAAALRPELGRPSHLRWDVLADHLHQPSGRMKHAEALEETRVRRPRIHKVR